jgi:hypothetical protein
MSRPSTREVLLLTLVGAVWAIIMIVALIIGLEREAAMLAGKGM